MTGVLWKGVCIFVDPADLHIGEGGITLLRAGAEFALAGCHGTVGLPNYKAKAALEVSIC